MAAFFILNLKFEIRNSISPWMDAWLPLLLHRPSESHRRLAFAIRCRAAREEVVELGLVESCRVGRAESGGQPGNQDQREIEFRISNEELGMKNGRLLHS